MIKGVSTIYGLYNLEDQIKEGGRRLEPNDGYLQTY